MLALMPKPNVYNPEDGAWDRSDPEWEMTFWPRTIWIDAGTQSGISVVWFHPQRLLDIKKATTRSILAHWSTYVSGPENDQAREILRLVRGLGGPTGLTVGAESFTVQRISKEPTFLSSPRISSKVEFGLWSGIRDHDNQVRRRDMLWQSPSDIEPGQVGAGKLKPIGLYTRGPDHINDSMQHCLLHLKRMRVSGLGMFEKLYGWNVDWEDS